MRMIADPLRRSRRHRNAENKMDRQFQFGSFQGCDAPADVSGSPPGRSCASRQQRERLSLSLSALAADRWHQAAAELHRTAQWFRPVQWFRAVQWCRGAKFRRRDVSLNESRSSLATPPASSSCTPMNGDSLKEEGPVALSACRKLTEARPE